MLLRFSSRGLYRYERTDRSEETQRNTPRHLEKHGKAREQEALPLFTPPSPASPPPHPPPPLPPPPPICPLLQNSTAFVKEKLPSAGKTDNSVPRAPPARCYGCEYRVSSNSHPPAPPHDSPVSEVSKTPPSIRRSDGMVYNPCTDSRSKKTCSSK